MLMEGQACHVQRSALVAKFSGITRWILDGGMVDMVDMVDMVCIYIYIERLFMVVKKCYKATYNL
jgi:hypothetical protein